LTSFIDKAAGRSTDHNVVWLDVQVQYAYAVQLRHGVGELRRD
jgi:hypothetical protein